MGMLRRSTCWGTSATLLIAIVAVLANARHVDTDSENSSYVANNTKSNELSYRLPDNLVPDEYDLEIRTYLDKEFQFEGKVKILMRCLQPTSRIILHERGLNISESEVKVTRVPENTEVKVVSHERVPDNNFYIVNLAQPLAAGAQYELNIPYHAPLSTGLAGYYRSSYTDKASGKIKWMAVTQFEPTDARRAFPCFDEPALKARFRVTLVHKSHLRAISNMPLTSSTTEENGWTRDEFAESVPMSTYLVAFVVSEFASLESTSNSTMFRVWARPDAITQATYSLDIAPKLLDFFERYFDVPYALPKMDMIAIPDFNSGAMENWGLVTYRESAMLYDESSSPASAQESVTRVISHELAHQWFGNLVTMQWWEDLWLNEGFATYAAALGLANVQPAWGSLDDQVVEAMLSVFSLDSLQSSHPVSNKISHPSEILQIFDPISYSKGAFLLRMMSHFLGAETFRRGVTRYLKTHKFGSASQDSLWSALEEQAAFDDADSTTGRQQLTRGTVKQVMDSWTLQTGYPLVSVSRNYENNTATVTQARFVTDWLGRSALESASEAPLWWIPLSITDARTACQGRSDTRPRAWLHEDSATLEDLPSKTQWILLNVNATGLYRVNYDPENWALLSKALLDPETRDMVPVLNRAQLLDDALDLARAGQLDYVAALNLVRYLRHERNYLPWRAALSNLAYFTRMTRRHASYGTFKKLMRTLLEPVYSELGSEPFRARSQTDSLPNTKLRSLLLSWACSMGVKDCENRAVEMFSAWREQKDPDNENHISVDLRGVVYCTAVRLQGQPAWDFVWDRYVAANVAAEKTKLLAALACTREIWLLHKLLDLSIEENSGVRKQDTSFVFSVVARSGSGFYVAREFLTTRIKDIHAFLGPKASRLARFVAAIAESMNTEYDLAKLRQLRDDNEVLLKDAKLAVSQALENAAINVQWRSKHLDTVTKWLNEHSDAAYFA